MNKDKTWESVWDPVAYSIYSLVESAIYDSVGRESRRLVRESVDQSIWTKLEDPVRDSIRRLVDAVGMEDIDE